MKGYNSKNKNQIVYPVVRSAILPVPHGPDVPIPVRPENLEQFSSESDVEVMEIETSDSDYLPGSSAAERGCFNQSELNDLVRDLALSKELAELLGSRLEEKNLICPKTSFYWFRQREIEFKSFFSEDGYLVYCNNVTELMLKLGLPNYDPSEWRLFIDASKRILKGVLLHNGNVFGSVPVAYSVILKESYANLQLMLLRVNYSEHNWQICGDFKVLTMLLGQQSGFTKFPCFLCLWDSRARVDHWTKKDWPPRESLEVGSKSPCESF